MNSRTRRTAAVALAVALSLSTVVAAAPGNRDEQRERSPFVRVIKKIQKFFGIAVHDDLPLPPFPH